MPFMKTICTNIVLFLFATTIFAQTQEEIKPVITFENTTCDFGEVLEEEYVFCDFEFTNTGTKDLIIFGAYCSVGSMTSDWDKTPVPPNGKGKIKVCYGTYRRPGKADKTVRVESNATNSSVILRVKGNVIPKEKVQGAIMIFTNTEIDLGEIFEKDGDYITVNFEFTNTGTEDLIIQDVKSPCCPTQWERKPIPPNGKGSIGVSHWVKGRVGEFRKSIIIYSNSIKADDFNEFGSRIVVYYKGIVIGNEEK